MITYARNSNRLGFSFLNRPESSNTGIDRLIAQNLVLAASELAYVPGSRVDPSEERVNLRHKEAASQFFAERGDHAHPLSFTRACEHFEIEDVDQFEAAIRADPAALAQVRVMPSGAAASPTVSPPTHYITGRRDMRRRENRSAAA